MSKTSDLGESSYIYVCFVIYIYYENYATFPRNHPTRQNAAFKGNIYFVAIDIGEREMHVCFQGSNFVSVIKHQVELRRNKQFE